MVKQKTIKYNKVHKYTLLPHSSVNIDSKLSHNIWIYSAWSCITNSDFILCSQNISPSWEIDSVIKKLPFSTLQMTIFLGRMAYEFDPLLHVQQCACQPQNSHAEGPSCAIYRFPCKNLTFQVRIKNLCLTSMESRVYLRTREGFLRKNIVAVLFFQNCAIHPFT